MKRARLALAAAIFFPNFQIPASELPRDVAGIDYVKSTGLVAGAYQGGQVVVWELESGKVKTVLNAAGQRATRNKPLGRFSPDGRRIALTAEGDAGLMISNLETGASTPVVPRRLLYLGIRAIRWSRQEDTLLVALGRDVLLVNSSGHIVWQRRLETQSVISDVIWNLNEQSYTVATDDTTVSAYDTVSGQLIASNTLDSAAHGTDVKLDWTSDLRGLLAGVQHANLVLLSPDSLKARKTIPCKCLDFAWSPTKKEIAATAPPNIVMFSDAGQKARELKASFDGPSPVAWTDEGHILTAYSESAVVLRETRTGKIVKTLAFPETGAKR